MPRADVAAITLFRHTATISLSRHAGADDDAAFR